MFKQITHNNQHLATILHANYHAEGIQFFSKRIKNENIFL